MSRTRQETADEAGRQVDHREIADAILAENEIVTVRESGEMLVWDNGVFREGAEALIKSETEARVPKCTNQFRREVIGTIEALTFVPLESFDPDPCLLHVLNGFVDVRTGRLSPQTALHLSRIRLPVKFDPKAKCPAILKFLNRVLPNPNDRRNVLEDAATALIRDARFQTAYMYCGSGNNGKSTWLAVLIALLGTENVSCQTLHDLGMSRFGPGYIEGKLAIIYPDIASAEIKLTGKLKSIIGGDRIEVERKNHDFHSIHPTCKLFFSCNELPEVSDSTDAWFRRWRQTDWEVQITREEKDPVLLAKLTTPEELSGLLNVLLGLARSMIARGGFTTPKSAAQNRATWGDKSDPFGVFIKGELTTDPGSIATTATLYMCYVAWCGPRSFNAMTQTAFVEELKRRIPILPLRQVGRDRARGWKGVGIKTKGNVSGASSASGTLTANSIESLKVEGDRKPDTPDIPDTILSFQPIDPDLGKAFRAIISGSLPLVLPQPTDDYGHTLPVDLLMAADMVEKGSTPAGYSERDPALEAQTWVCSRGDGGPWADQSIAKSHAELTGHEIVSNHAAEEDSPDEHEGE